MMKNLTSVFIAAHLMLPLTEAAMADDLRATRTLQATPDKVWAALTDTQWIKRWWGPFGFTAPKVRANVVVGQATLVCMTGANFPVICNTWTYREIVPGSRLVFDQGWANTDGAEVSPNELGLPAHLPRLVPHVIEIVAGENGTTILHWSEFGYPDAQTAAMSRAGLEQVLDKLATAVE
ncbi:SRPBCC domain-containing protein [Peteryoungia desertarenae]|uniref:SRPBCC domain-containing protein n=1 Tax=Peteryoungia desertarenae TaxID=1813451 RepID=A0ABX6QNU4_9HYPH|nr:SRPBCC domain-containing protein [Peteryoungia desertarenae]QLF69932.1 SRPBCC domain-containing protein [Peteryoungia desertarenae]